MTIQLLHGDCLERMKDIESGSIDLTVTSPPYDNLRTYNDTLVWNETIWQAVIKELFRVTKIGGVVVWIVGDATIKGSETGTSFKQALWAMECGLRLHDTMIWEKPNFSMPCKNRYHQVFEYMFIFSKGKPKTYNEIKDVPNIHAGKVLKGTKGRDKNGNKRKLKEQVISDFQARSNIWIVPSSERSEHPAIFPEQLANDHIISWSNENDLVYDCFMGSGTVAKMSILNNRNWIGSEISSEYCDIIEERIKKAWEEKRKEKDLQAGTIFGNEM